LLYSSHCLPVLAQFSHIYRLPVMLLDRLNHTHSESDRENKGSLAHRSSCRAHKPTTGSARRTLEQARVVGLASARHRARVAVAPRAWHRRTAARREELVGIEIARLSRELTTPLTGPSRRRRRATCAAGWKSQAASAVGALLTATGAARLATCAAGWLYEPGSECCRRG
jgi:hypothetical protein